MNDPDILTSIVDTLARDRAAQWLRRAGARLPRFAELADPATIPQSRVAALHSVDPDRPDPANLFRVHWYNGRSRTDITAIPPHFVLPAELTGVRSPIVVALGCFFPMIAAHKVLAAYGCLIPHLVTGRFDPARHKAVWPSTGNYCRGGIAISRILGCRGIAVLPAGMSEERFEWLRAWVTEPEDIIRTPGSESNVKEIYDRCAELARNPDNLVLNQFAEFGNYVAHHTCTGPALARIFEAVESQRSGCRLAAFVAASGSAGTLAAGDYLKEKLGARIVAVEASECPTLLRNGFGEHNIQGIGDKHVPYIHNVMNTDLVVGVSDHSVAGLDLLFNNKTGLAYLADRRGVDPEAIDELKYLGLSGIANVVAAIKTAKHLELGDEDVLISVATDSAALYGSERRKFLAANYPAGFDIVNAGEIFGQHLLGAADNDVLELTHDERSRIFNLGYFTWVEQQGVPLVEFERRRNQGFWRGLRQLAAAWDELIAEFNARAGFGEVC
ncbi:MAG: pyridoxal-phosphate dependent enzyme [Alphaproteobacteria bacterium]|nr:pyridoxal-phosphate dependent enzyme [Alphaproteobacteria bacterium]